MAFSPDGKSLAVAFNKPECTWIVDLATGLPRISIDRQGRHVYSGGHCCWLNDNLLRDLVYSQTVENGIARHWDHYCIWDVRSGEQVLSTLRSDDEGIGGYMAASADGQTVAYTQHLNHQDRLVIWDLSTKSMRVQIPGAYWIPAFSPDGTNLAAACKSANGCRITISDVKTGKEWCGFELPRMKWEGEEQSVGPRNLSFSNDGRKLTILNVLWPVGEGPVAKAKLGRLNLDGEGGTSPWCLIQSFDFAAQKVETQRYDWSYPHMVEGWTGSSEIFRWRAQDNKVCFLNPLEGTERFAIHVKGRPAHGFGSPGPPQFEVYGAPSSKTVLLAQEYGHRTKILRRIPNWHGSELYTVMDLQMFDSIDGHRLGSLRDQRFGCFSQDGRKLATWGYFDDRLYLWDLPLGAPWLAILTWAVAPSVLVGGLFAFRGWHKESNRVS